MKVKLAVLEFQSPVARVMRLAPAESVPWVMVRLVATVREPPRVTTSPAAALAMLRLWKVNPPPRVAAPAVPLDRITVLVAGVKLVTVKSRPADMVSPAVAVRVPVPALVAMLPLTVSARVLVDRDPPLRMSRLAAATEVSMVLAWLSTARIPRLLGVPLESVTLPARPAAEPSTRVGLLAAEYAPPTSMVRWRSTVIVVVSPGVRVVAAGMRRS